MTLAEQVTNRADLRQKICDMLKTRIPGPIPGGGMPSTHPMFSSMTGGLTQARLLADWAKRGPKEPGLTSCNSFAGWVAQQIGAKSGSTLCAGKLDLSGVEREVPGSWVMANTGEAIDAKLHPLPGDFYCSSRPGQPFAHVGIVVEIDPETQAWNWVAGGQGGKLAGCDWIKWGPWLPDHSRTFSQARPNVPGWVDIGNYFFPDEQ